MIGYALTLPLSPMTNEIDFCREVQAIVNQAKLPEMASKLCIVMRVFPKDRKKQGIDKRAKSVMSALKYAGVFVNEEQVAELHVTRGPVVLGGRIELMVGEIDEGGGKS